MRVRCKESRLFGKWRLSSRNEEGLDLLRRSYAASAVLLASVFSGMSRRSQRERFPQLRLVEQQWSQVSASYVPLGHNVSFITPNSF